MSAPEKDYVKRQGDVISAAVRDMKVRNWLAGSTKKADAITLAELRAAGYDVVNSDQEAGR